MIQKFKDGSAVKVLAHRLDGQWSVVSGQWSVV